MIPTSPVASGVASTASGASVNISSATDSNPSSTSVTSPGVNKAFTYVAQEVTVGDLMERADAEANEYKAPVYENTVLYDFFHGYKTLQVTTDDKSDIYRPCNQP